MMLVVIKFIYRSMYFKFFFDLFVDDKKTDGFLKCERLLSSGPIDVALVNIYDS
jgi:hypothetical protein